MKKPRAKKMVSAPAQDVATRPERFDTALPETLAGAREARDVRHVPIVRQAEPRVSPYIIKLTRQGADDRAVTTSRIDELARSLVFDGEMDDALPEDLADDFSVSLDEVRAQLRDADRVVTPIAGIKRAPEPVAPRAAVVSPSTHVPAGSVDLRALLTIDAEDDDTDAVEGDIAALPIATVGEDGAMFAEEIIDDNEDSTEAPSPVAGKRFGFTFVLLSSPLRRAVASFVALSFVVVLPLHAMQSLGGASASVDDISAVGRAAVDDLTRGADAFANARYDVAEDDFARATEKFSDAQTELEGMHAAIAAVVNVIPQTNRTYDSVSGLITAGRELSTVAQIMSNVADSVAPKTAIDVVTKLQLLSTAAGEAGPHADAATEALTHVDPAVIPADYADRVTTLKAYAPQLSASLGEFTSFSNALATMLGGDGAMKYLVAFQNPTELRPTGGFIGSFAEIDVRHGAIDAMRVPGGGTYDTQGQLTKFVAAPTPLSILNARWELQDANWFPDFPTSAKKVQWFYENAGGPTTDGVIGVNATFVVNLLGILGPVDMPEYGVTIDAENFMFEAQKAVEITYDKEANTPKAFIGDLAPLLLDRIAEADMTTFLKILNLVGTSLAQKDIQLNFASNDLQAAANELGWSGAMKQTNGDYLEVVNTNLGGGKTDAVIDQNVDVDVTVQDDGTVVNTVTVTKVHHGIANALFTGKNNVDYIRLYVPEGSELLAADGFEAPADSAFEVSDVPLARDEDLELVMSDVGKDAVSGTDTWSENGKTVFGNWMQTKPGETQTVRFTYRLPFTVAPNTTGFLAAAEHTLGFGGVAPYTLLLQKQPGADTRVTNVRVTLPNGMSTVFASDSALTSTSGTTVRNATDTFFRLLVERN